MKSNQEKGFTLIELLIVIAIVAVLATVVVLTLNPAELLRQARDSNRISDLSTLKSAMSLYLADGQSTSAWNNVTCYVDAAAAICVTARFSANYATTATSTSRAVNATGWVPVNFTLISSGSPIGQLPVDPVRDATHFYAYAASSSTGLFEVNAVMESTRYANGGSGNVESTDGGNNADLFEVGTKLDI